MRKRQGSFKRSERSPLGDNNFSTLALLNDTHPKGCRKMSGDMLESLRQVARQEFPARAGAGSSTVCVYMYHKYVVEYM